MTPTMMNDEWFVLQGGEKLAGPFRTNSEAWRWIDRQAGEATSKAEDTADFVFRKMANGGAA